MIKYSKIRNVKTPIVRTKDSVGIDIFVPNFTSREFKSLKFKDNVRDSEGFIGLEIRPGHNLEVPSGLRFNIPNNKLIKVEYGYNTSHKGLLVGASTIDHYNRCELIIQLYNVSDESILIAAGAKLCRLVIYNKDENHLEEVPIDNLFLGVT